jgi:hypothetical protein
MAERPPVLGEKVAAWVMHRAPVETAGPGILAADTGRVWSRTQIAFGVVVADQGEAGRTLAAVRAAVEKQGPNVVTARPLAAGVRVNDAVLLDRGGQVEEFVRGPQGWYHTMDGVPAELRGQYGATLPKQLPAPRAELFAAVARQERAYLAAEQMKPPTAKL